MYQKSWSDDVWFPRYGVQKIEFFVIMDCFLLFYPLMDPENQNFEKMKKKITYRYYHFTNVYHKWQSYDTWFFRYGVQQTKLFVIFGPLFLKKLLEISQFYICVLKIKIRCYTVPEIWCVTDVIDISHFGLFFAFLPS